MRRNRHPTEADNIMMGGEIYLFSKSGYSIADNIFLVDFATMRMMGTPIAQWQTFGLHVEIAKKAHISAVC